ncbi:MAG TPA: thioesterase domain-containing protein [Pyrinomonadaceae bacterium]|nr:thioesterase domain-containing protein [Pyrinomonadaceae bacterium]
MFVSGQRAPQVPSGNPPRYNLPEQEFIDELRKDGTPQEVLEHPELLQLMLPLFRANYRLSETYLYREERPLEVPISAYGGEQDAETSLEALEGWREQTAASFKLTLLPGDHHLLNSSRQRLLEELNRELAAIRTGT